MTILITNDDGLSIGMEILLKAAKKFSSAYAIVPNRQRSAVSRSLTLHKPLRMSKLRNDLATVSGTPADCVLFGIHSKEFETPKVVLSGINWGDNSGLSALLGSGTVGACWMAATEGIGSIAFSIRRGPGEFHEDRSWGDEKEIGKAVENVIRELLPKVSKNKVFNVNMPFGVNGKTKIEYVKKLQREKYGTQVVKRKDPDGNDYYWIVGYENPIEKDTDVHHIKTGKIAIAEINIDRLQKI